MADEHAERSDAAPDAISHPTSQAAADPGGVAPPSSDDLAAIGSDLWARALRAIRAGLNDLDQQELTPLVLRLRAAPTSRLAGGRSRDDLHRLLAEGGAPWLAVLARLRADASLAAELDWLVTGSPAPASVASAAAPGADKTAAAEPDESAASARSALRRHKERAKALRTQRDDARRRLEGAEARADAAERVSADLAQRLRDTEAELERVRGQVAAAGEEREKAVERERRRTAGELATLQADLRAMRRREDERGRERERRARAREATARAAREEAAEHARERAQRPTRVAPARPTSLPAGVAPGTTEATRLVLTRGRRVLIDGYNVAKTHRDHLTPEQQRDWLVQLLASWVARAGLRPEVFFDGEERGGYHDARRGVTVHFSPQGVDADDDITFAVAALPSDEPIVVVTDDRELVARVGAHGADVIGTRAFLSLVE